MSETPNLALPLLASAQAQKHVTLNEALTRIDALTQAAVVSADLSAPPIGVDGDAYIVANGGTGDWAGLDGRIAVFSNGGWIAAEPASGWRVWVADRGAYATFVGGRWVHALTGPWRDGASTSAGLITGDEALSGPSVTAALAIPDRAIVLGVTARVTQAVAGTLSGWRIGVAGANDRYGGGIGLQKDSVAIGVTGAPVAYYADTPLVLTAENGDFTGGVVRLAIHYLALTPPDIV